MNDYAGVLTPDARGRLEQQLRSYETGTRQMAVAIFRSLDGESLEDVSIRLADQWKIGGRANNDGVLLTVFAGDHKLRFEVGYGLEGALPDAMAARIIRELIAPRFRAGDYEGGLRDGFAEVNRLLGGGKSTLPAAAPTDAPGGGGAGIPIWLLLGGALLMLALFRRGIGFFPFFGGWRGRGGGGGFGGRNDGGGGFSGGGGGFGGGGASGNW